MTQSSGYWPSPWPAEDGGPMRLQVPVGEHPGLGLRGGRSLRVTHRESPGTTMVVLRDPGEVYVLRHTFGPEVVSWVEQIHPESLEVLRRTPDLPAGPMWPGGLACHADGSLHVVFGNHAHRLSPELEVLASATLPRARPYNSFVLLPDGSLVTKDFGGPRPGREPEAPEPAELLVLDPVDLTIRARVQMPEPSIARLSAEADDIYVVGDTSLFRVRWNGTSLRLDPDLCSRYRTLEGQTYGWDAVLAAGAAWFLDDGEGSDRYNGSFTGMGISAAPLHVVRVDLDSGAVALTEVCGLPNGLIANPPLVDASRGVVVGFDSSNGVLVGFALADDGTLTPSWQRHQHHASHLLLFPTTGELVTADHDGSRMAEQVVVVDIDTGEELARADSGGPLQSAVFPSVGWDHDVYLTSFSTLTRVRGA